MFTFIKCNRSISSVAAFLLFKLKFKYSWVLMDYQKRQPGIFRVQTMVSDCQLPRSQNAIHLTLTNISKVKNSLASSLVHKFTHCFKNLCKISICVFLVIGAITCCHFIALLVECHTTQLLSCLTNTQCIKLICLFLRQSMAFPHPLLYQHYYASVGKIIEDMIKLTVM